MDIKDSVIKICGVGEKRAKVLKNLGIETIEDLLYYFPRNYENRMNYKKIIDAQDGESVLIKAIITSDLIESNKGKLRIYKVKAEDETGEVYITWFNKYYLKNIIKIREKFKFFGKVNIVYGKKTITNPEFELEGKEKNTNKIIPIYPLTANLTQNYLREIISRCINTEILDNIEFMPKQILDKGNLYDLKTALTKIHFPNNYEEYFLARKRLAFDELFAIQYCLQKLKRLNNTKKGIVFDKVDISPVVNSLPYKLTNSQNKVLEEIFLSMESNNSCNRLLQGDVGSGKTVISAICSYKAFKSGYQVAVMAPTSILATQHLETYKNILEKFGIKIELLTSKITKTKRQEILTKLKNHDIDIIIGTHALLQEDVEFAKLGLVITDEQHRFGVKQRTTIANKATNPDILVMSATPIPRTLALILYGDLDISIIDEMPEGRKAVETYAVDPKKYNERINKFIIKNINEGHQCYVVCPVVEENENSELKSVQEVLKQYQTKEFSPFTAKCIYGKMKQEEKNQIMEDFKNKKIDILVSTTVIEVGVNIPNANIMVIENAERFGLSTLHQLRGRVGRGTTQSYCILKYQTSSKDIINKLEYFTKEHNGFKLAKKDLELRGGGDFFGIKQHGILNLKIANIFIDTDIIKMSEYWTKTILQNKLSEDEIIKLENNFLNKLNIQNLNL